MRKSLFDVIKLLFGKYFLVVYVTLGIYILGIIAILNEIGFWTNTDLKDFIFWLVSVAFVLIFNLNKAKDSKYFKGILIDALKAVAILEFVINFYNFSLLTELILLPSLVFIGLLQAVSESDSKFIKVSKILSSLMSIFGLGLLVFSIYHLIVGYSNFFRIGTLHSFLLPIILTIVFVPYLYVLSLFSIYESYFIRLDFMTVKKEKVKKAKKYILWRANLNINRLNNIIDHFDKKVFYDDTNLKKYIKQISKLKKNSG